jgi:hypothetical protein
MMVNADHSGRNKVDAYHQSLPAPGSAPLSIDAL